MRLKIAYFVGIAVTVVACTHAPKQETAAAEFDDQLKTAIVNNLKARKDILKVTDIKVTRTSGSDNQLKYSYTLSYESQSTVSGTASSTVEGDIELIKVADQSWKATSVKPRLQSIVFNEPLVVNAKKPRVQ
jgi:hypothetical protein